VTTLPQERPAGRRAEDPWLPSERIVAVLLVLVGLTCVALLALGVLNVLVT
jgi:hypothetical protein